MVIIRYQENHEAPPQKKLPSTHCLSKTNASTQIETKREKTLLPAD